MIEVLPYLHYAYYEDEGDIREKRLKRNRIKCLIHLSSTIREFKYSDMEEVSISLRHPEGDAANVEFYGYLQDVIEFIYHKVIEENVAVCIIGHKEREEVDALLMAYFIRFAKVNYQEAHHYVLSKKLSHYYERSAYYSALKKYSSFCENIAYHEKNY